MTWTSTFTSSTSSCCGASAVILLAILAVRVSSRAGLPSLLLYLLIGVALGEEGLGIGFEDAQLAHALGFAALIVILAEGGLTTPWPDVQAVDAARRRARHARRRASRSAVMTLAGPLPARACSWELAVLLGAVTSPTDAAAVFSVLRVVPLPKRLQGALEAESGLNDAPTVVLVTLVSTGAFADNGVLGAGALIVYELVAGVAIGLAVGFGGAWLMRRAALPASGLYPLAVLTLCFLAYGGATGVHASGFAAVYVGALVLGNQELPHRAATRSFAEGVAWLAQIGLFVMLGLLLSPGRITLGNVGTAIVAGLVLTFVARPLSVLASSVVRPDAAGASCRFISWAGLRGAVPIVLATIPLSEGVDGSEQALRHRLRAGRRLHAADRSDAADGGQGPQGDPTLRAARPRHRGRAPRAGRRRPAADHHQPGLADARRRGRRAAAAGRRRRSRWWSATGRRWCPNAARCSSTATTCWSSPRASCATRPRSGCAR